MAELLVLKAKELIKILEKMGFASVRQRGSHIRLISPDGRKTTVPNHPGSDIQKVCYERLSATIFRSLLKSFAHFNRSLGRPRAFTRTTGPYAGYTIVIIGDNSPKLTATLTDKAGVVSDITGDVAWSISNPSVSPGFKPRANRNQILVDLCTENWIRVRMVLNKIEIPEDELRSFCNNHGVTKLSLFGSILRADFADESDIDVLVEFEKTKEPGLEFFSMEKELSDIFGKHVDLNTEAFLSPYFRDEVKKEAKTIYVKNRRGLRSLRCATD